MPHQGLRYHAIGTVTKNVPSDRETKDSPESPAAAGQPVLLLAKVPPLRKQVVASAKVMMQLPCSHIMYIYIYTDIVLCWKLKCILFDMHDPLTLPTTVTCQGPDDQSHHQSAQPLPQQSTPLDSETTQKRLGPGRSNTWLLGYSLEVSEVSAPDGSIR